VSAKPKGIPADPQERGPRPAALYLRVGRTGCDAEGPSLRSQREACERWATDNGVPVIAIDEGPDRERRGPR
jgi:hypothetical protein